VSGWLYAFDEQALVQTLSEVKQVVNTQDRGAWRSFWHHRGEAIVNLGGVPEHLGEERLPEPHAKGLLQILRATAHVSSLRRAELWEKAWHVQYPELSDEEAGFEVSESAEYEAIGQHVFAVGAMPPGLEFLDEQPAVATNWIGGRSVSRLWQMEEEEGFLAAAGAHLAARGTPLGHDLLAVRGMLEFAAPRGAALYLWDPGS
jgi:hypothetical protein